MSDINNVAPDETNDNDDRNVLPALWITVNFVSILVMCMAFYSAWDLDMPYTFKENFAYTINKIVNGYKAATYLFGLGAAGFFLVNVFTIGWLVYDISLNLLDRIRK